MIKKFVVDKVRCGTPVELSLLTGPMVFPFDRVNKLPPNVARRAAIALIRV